MSKKLRELLAKRAQAAAAKAESLKLAGGLLDKAAAENRDLTPDEVTKFADAKTAAAARDGEIERIQAQIDIEQELINAQTTAGTVAVFQGNASMVSVTERIEQDPRRGYNTFGEFAREVAQAGISGNPVGRLAATPTTFNNESSGPDGGFAIPPQFSSDIWNLSLGEDSLIPLTQNTETSGNSMIFPKDETTPWGGTGVQVYWQNEANAANQSKLQFSSDAMVLHKMMALVPVTNEQIADGFAIGSYLNEVAPPRITYKSNEAILFGDGVGKPMGALNSPAAIVQAKDSGQLTGTLSVANIANMRSRLLAGSRKTSIWIANPDLEPALAGLFIGQYPIITQSLTNPEVDLLRGRPLIYNEHANAFSSQGDLNLLDLKGYRTLTKAGGIQTATSMHLYFDADAMAFRFIFRLNGKPILSKPVTPPKSTNTRSHFVTLAAR